MTTNPNDPQDYGDLGRKAEDEIRQQAQRAGPHADDTRRYGFSEPQPRRNTNWWWLLLPLAALAALVIWLATNDDDDDEPSSPTTTNSLATTPS